MDQNSILLDSGTNELEIVEFGIGSSRFGINVIKVREIIVPQPVQKIPRSHPCLEGIIQLRGKVLPVINLSDVLHMPQTQQVEKDKDKFIVAEFNKMKVVFRVHDVSLIRRISWEDIEKPTDLQHVEENNLTGIVKLESHMILLLDFEKVVIDMNPESGLNIDGMNYLDDRKRSHRQIIIVEDSLLMQKLLKEILEKAGYERLTFFSNGKQALEFLEEQEKSRVDLVITDIEMPQMDGHHLTKRIKESNKWKATPVVIFSSLITDDLRHKGEKVGADAQVSKPEAGELVDIIDRLIQ